MNANVSFNQIVDELVNVFSNPAQLASYNGRGGSSYICLCGWAGTMSPANRVAFVETFGEDVTSEAEKAARETIAAREKAYKESKHANYCEEADANSEKADFVPMAGAFVWAVSSWMKRDDGRGLCGELADLIAREEEKGDPCRPCLTKIARVIDLSASDFLDGSTPDRLTKAAAVAGDPFEGGQTSDDLGEGVDPYALTDEEKRVIYSVAVAVVDPAGRWYLIDCEGYDYARYLMAPHNWRTMYAEDVAGITAEREEAAREAEQTAQREAEQRRAAYVARCAKWAPLMADVRDLEKAANEARTAHGWRSDITKKAERAAHNATRKNILTMCRAAFPGVKFSLTKNSGYWGADFTLTYYDGPTLEEFQEKTDLALFAAYRDTFDGMTDSSDIERAEFTTFADKYVISSLRGGIDVEREETEPTKAANLAKICEAVPELAKDGEAWPRVASNKLLSVCAALVPAFGADVMREAEKAIIYNGWDRSATEIQRCIFNVISYYNEPTAPTPDDPTKGRTSADGEGMREDGAKASAPAAGALVMEDYSAKACAVFGDTASYKEELKQLGGRFNGHLKRNGTTCAGWIFSKAKAEKVAAFIAAAAAPATVAQPETVKASADDASEPDANQEGARVACAADVITSDSAKASAPDASEEGANQEGARVACAADAVAVPTAAEVDALRDLLASRATDTDREPLPAAVVPSSTIADACGTPCAYGVSEKSPNRAPLSVKTFEDDSEGAKAVRWEFCRASLPYKYGEFAPVNETIDICTDYITVVEGAGIDPQKEDEHGARLLDLIEELRAVNDEYKRDYPDELKLLNKFTSEAAQKAAAQAAYEAKSAHLRILKELHTLAEKVLKPELSAIGCAVSGRVYGDSEKSPKNETPAAVPVFRLNLAYENEEGETALAPAVINCAFEELPARVLGMPHPCREYQEKGYQCTDYLVLDTPLLTVAMLNERRAPGLYFLADNGEKITPNYVYFGCDSRWARTDGSGTPNGSAYCCYNCGLHPVYNADGTRLIDRTLANVSAKYKDGILCDYYRE